MRQAIYVFVLTSLMCVCGAFGEPTARSISTSGEGIVYAVPDKVIVTLGVQKFDKNLDQAKDENDQASDTLLKAIKSLHVDEKDIQAAQMSVELVYENNQEPIRGIQGYTTRRNYTVTLKDPALLAGLIDTGLKNGANYLEGFQYDTTELRKYRDEARGMAIRAAKEKAVALAKELDCKPGRPMTITESGSGQYYPMAANAFAVGGFGGGGGFGGAAMRETMPTGQIPISASVNVTFELQDLP